MTQNGAFQNVIAVTSPSFYKNKHLRNELTSYFPNTRFNTSGKEIKSKDEVIELLKPAEGAIVSLSPITAEVLDSCPNLKAIAKYGVGTDNVDIEACKERDIFFGWRGGLNKRSVSEEVLCFMLGLARNVYGSSQKLKSGIWEKSGGFQLSGKTVGIIGLGHVGKDLAQLLKPFDCRILANDKIDIYDYCTRHGLVPVAKETIYRESDFVTLHVTLDSSTRHMIDNSVLEMMKPSAYLINTSRGAVVNQADLKKALMSRRIAGAALDVYENEPPEDREFISLPNLICAPHIGGSSLEGIMAMGMSAIEYMKDYFEGTR